MALVDELIGGFDRALRALAGVHTPVRPSPAHDIAESDLTEEMRARSAALMRVNHVGEVCAQALYEGQALDGARTDDPRVADRGGTRRGGPSGVVRRAHRGAGRSHQPAQSRLVWRLVCPRPRRRRAWRPVEPRVPRRDRTPGRGAPYRPPCAPRAGRRQDARRRPGDADRRGAPSPDRDLARGCGSAVADQGAQCGLASRVMTTVSYRI